MRSKRSAPAHLESIPGDEGYREVLHALQLDGERLEETLIGSIDMIDQMLDEDLCHQNHLSSIQSFARESVVNVPALIDQSSQTGHLVIKCNERLETLVHQVKEQAFQFTEHAEEMRRLIDLNVVTKNGVEQQLAVKWKGEVVHWQGEISSDQMHLLRYYRDRSEIASRLLDQPRISDYWIELVELDEDCFFKLRTSLFHLRLFNVRLSHFVSHWLDCCSSEK